MKIIFLFDIAALLLAFSDARYKPELEIYEIRASDDNDKLQINDLIKHSDEKSDSILSQLLRPYKKEKDQKLSRHKNQKMAKVVDDLISKLKTLKNTHGSGGNEPEVYVINGNLILDEEDDFKHKYFDETRSVPIIVNTKDIIELLGHPPHRYKRPILRLQDEDRTAPPPQRYVYASDK